MPVSKPNNFVDFIARFLDWEHARVLLRRDPKIVLTKKFANFNALHICVSRAAPLELIKELAMHSVLLNEPDKYGRTPLHFACMDFRIFDDPYGDWSIRLKIIQVLLDCGANPNLKTNDGYTPLDMAVEDKCANGAVYKLLISKMNPLEIEKYNGGIGVEEFLLKKTVKTVSSSEPNTCHFWNCFCNDED
jgi:ankyrin repeat protein